jgi:hypothetical protein
MRGSVLITDSAVALVSTGILAGCVASAAISPSASSNTPKKAGGENREQSEASTVKACLGADLPPAWAEASQGDDINKLRRRRNERDPEACGDSGFGRRRI